MPPVTAGGLAWRGARREDAPVILATLNALAAADNDPFRWSLAEIEERLAASYRDLDNDYLLGFEGPGEGALRAFAEVDVSPGDATVARAILLGGVHPDRRGEGIGRELLAWQIARGRQKLAASALADAHVPAWFVVHMEDDGPKTLARTYERAGFVVRRYYSDLRRDLSVPVPPASTPDGTLRLVPWTPELDEPLRLARNDAFRDHWGSQPRTRETWAEYRTAFMPAWTFMVVDDAPDVDALLASPDTDDETAAALRAGEPLVVAYQIASKYVEDFEVRGFTFGYSDNVGVRRAYRGRGLAPVVMTAGMRAMADDGMQYAALDVDTANPTGAVGLYAALGYEKQHGSRMLLIEL
ncbi:GNAT family N-acetyltransferase [Myceligenerans sp. TRM 65318]|uniref:GNAT family N-acetyltransferase n=1 Tax=Myceligenerans pegani TaxID=2776917 RepID=A0ABR9MX58_9MICO|nr:GNAT family N-acetyltransferase [Myceligenerans sp. TRM 65318]MBE3018228.1 GNAT family N-acetyltransferase [Myceligenerans sp. TRM 65318]